MEDEHHSPVSENRGAGDARTAGKNVLDRLHHELLLTDEPLGDKPDATLRFAHEKDKSPSIIPCLRGRHVEHLLEGDQGHDLISPMEDTVPEDGSGLFGNETDDLEHTRQRHGKCLVADFHQDCPKNGERQRKTYEKACDTQA